MAGAACAASFFIGAKAYYVQGRVGDDLENSKVVELSVPSIPLQTPDKTQLNILSIVSRHPSTIASSMVRNEVGISAQVLSYHLKELVKKGLLQYVTAGGPESVKPTDGRKVYVSITNAGRLVLQWCGKA
jgi:predicted transcriptional regulator